VVVIKVRVIIKVFMFVYDVKAILLIQNESALQNSGLSLCK
jgi:hypothetical protein